MARVIGTATLEVKADTSAFHSALDGVGSKLSGTFSRMSSAIGALGLGHLAKEAISFGAEYRIQLDNAAASVRGLTDSEAEANALLKEMTDFAINTPFELPGVQKSVAQLLAVGKGFGVTSDNAVDYVEKLGNVIAITGGSDDTMVRVVRTLGQMSSSGKVLGQDMNQLAQNIPGLDVWGALAEGTGKSVEELRRLQDLGELDELVTGNEAVEILIGAMEDFPGAADAMERKMNTLEGAMAMFKDTIGIALADALVPFFDTLRTVMADDAVVSAVKTLAETFGFLASTIMQELAPILPNLINAFQRIILALVPAAPAIADLAMMFALALVAATPLIELLATLASTVTGLLMKLDPGVLGIISVALLAFWFALGGGGVFALIIAGLAALAVFIAQHWGAIAEAARVYTGMIVDAWNWLFENVLAPVGRFIMAIVDFFVMLYDTLVGNSIIPDLVNAIVEWFDKLFGWLVDIVSAIVSWIADHWQLLIAIILGPLGIILGLVITHWDTIKSVISTAINGIKTVLTTVWNAISSAINSIVNGISSFLSSAWETIKSTASAVWNAVKAVIMTPVNALSAAISGVIETVKGYFNFAGLVTKVSGIWNSVKEAILGPLRSAADLVGGIISRITSPVSTAIEGVKSATGWIPGTPWAQGGVYWGKAPLPSIIHGPEAMIPLSNPVRAMQVMHEAGLDRLLGQMGEQRGGITGPLVSMPGAIIQDATDADLVAQRTLVAMTAAMVA